MTLFKEKLNMMCSEESLISKYDVSIRFLGELELLHPDVRALALEVAEKTRKNQS
jgi:undecaprenyl pyrophosphate synthase